ncbi:MAG: Do family serine endopeptidase [Bacteroidales bacterium]|jgi:Do/DeqQ family serine protease|nr:Do family serine endopeptidase [Bacteroidales bacterium]MDD4215444.1 Do family serine endopeptidase [Bacteroidales bacterium]
MKRIVTTIGIALATSLITILAFRYADNKNQNIQTYFKNQLPAYPASFSHASFSTNPDFTAAAEKTIHAVVHIQTQYYYKNSYYDQFFGYDPFFNFFNQRRYNNTPIETMGSGVLISENGYIVTNNHVVNEATKIMVTLNDKRTYEAKIIGTDAGTDLALIKIEENNLPYITYGNSDEVKIGEWVLAVGNPFNLTSTVTAGIVSAKARDINIWGDKTTVESFIQTDAAINPGNSGGALVNTTGELIGINAAIASNTGSFTGYSFAIPSNIVRKIIADIMEFGQVQRAFMGLSFTDLDNKLAEAKKLKDLNGLYVQSIYEGGSAEIAGIKQGDVIVKVNGNNIHSSSEMKEILIRQRPGDKIDVTVLRENEEKNFTLTLQNREGGTAILNKSAESQNVFGATLTEIDENTKTRLGINNGVKISKLERGKLSNAGIKEGFIITRIDNKTMKTVNDVTNILSSKQGAVLIEGIYSNGMQAYFAFAL